MVALTAATAGLGSGANAATVGREIYEADGLVQAEGTSINFPANYYDELWNEGRPAPFLAVQEVLDTATSVVPDNLPGFFQYTNGVLKLVFNPETGMVWHIGHYYWKPDRILLICTEYTLQKVHNVVLLSRKFLELIC